MALSPFAKEFQDLARQSSRSYRAIAKLMGVSPALLARVLNGSRPPTTSFVDASIKAFSLTGPEAERLRYLAMISQEKISVKPKGPDEAEKIVAFMRELRGDDYLPE